MSKTNSVIVLATLLVAATSTLTACDVSHDPSTSGNAKSATFTSTQSAFAVSCKQVDDITSGTLSEMKGDSKLANGSNTASFTNVLAGEYICEFTPTVTTCQKVVGLSIMLNADEEYSLGVPFNCGGNPVGGSTGTGGSNPTGGSTGTGGSTPGTGGSTGTGGSNPTGGSTGTGGSTPGTGGSNPDGGAGGSTGDIYIKCVTECGEDGKCIMECIGRITGLGTGGNAGGSTGTGGSTSTGGNTGGIGGTGGSVGGSTGLASISLSVMANGVESDASVRLTCNSSQTPVDKTIAKTAGQRLIVADLPFCRYGLVVKKTGFVDVSQVIDIRDPYEQKVNVVMQAAGGKTCGNADAGDLVPQSDIALTCNPTLNGQTKDFPLVNLKEFGTNCSMTSLPAASLKVTLNNDSVIGGATSLTAAKNGTTLVTWGDGTRTSTFNIHVTNCP